MVVVLDEDCGVREREKIKIKKGKPSKHMPRIVKNETSCKVVVSFNAVKV